MHHHHDQRGDDILYSLDHHGRVNIYVGTVLLTDGTRHLHDDARPAALNQLIRAIDKQHPGLIDTALDRAAAGVDMRGADSGAVQCDGDNLDNLRREFIDDLARYWVTDGPNDLTAARHLRRVLDAAAHRTQPTRP
jgi:hypothetical protein